MDPATLTMAILGLLGGAAGTAAKVANAGGGSSDIPPIGSSVGNVTYRTPDQRAQAKAEAEAGARRFSSEKVEAPPGSGFWITKAELYGTLKGNIEGYQRELEALKRAPNIGHNASRIEELERNIQMIQSSTVFTEGQNIDRAVKGAESTYEEDQFEQADTKSRQLEGIAAGYDERKAPRIDTGRADQAYADTFDTLQGDWLQRLLALSCRPASTHPTTRPCLWPPPPVESLERTPWPTARPSCRLR